MSLSEAVREWLRGAFGPFVEGPTRSAAVRVELSDGAHWVKHYRSGRAWVQSERAFGVVVPALARAGVPVPRCRAASRDLRVRVLSEVQGRSATMADPPEVFAAAARILLHLRRIPCVQDPLPLGEAMHQRTAAWAMRPSAPASAPAILEWVDAHRPLLNDVRVWSHRDFHPRNWLGDSDALGLVDFEHTRPDHPLVDWVRLEAGGWSPAQRGAFVEVLGEPDELALRGNLAVFGLATWVWAREHRDVTLGRIGHRALALADFAP
ncbi:MAG: phosphotransferase [Myxococcota bacterium]